MIAEVLRRCFITAAATIACSSAALAQQNPVTKTTPAPAIPQAQPAASPSPPGLSKYGRKLQADGIVLRATGYDDFAEDAAGGVRRGDANVTSATFGADLNLQRIVGITGGRLHVTFNVENGPSISNFVDTGVTLQSRFKPYQNIRLGLLTYEQQFDRNRINIELGRTAPLLYFNSSPIYCQFQSNALCATPLGAPLYDGNLSPYPYSTWGGRVRVTTGPHTSIQAGAFEVNPSLIPTDGFDWSTRHATGTETPLEFDYGTELSDQRYPQHVRLGIFHDSSLVHEPYAAPPLLPGQLSGRTGFYAMGDQTVWRRSQTSTANLTAFGGYTQMTDPYSKYTSESNLGLLATGVVAGRPADSIGFSAVQFELGSSEAALLEATRARIGNPDPVSRSQVLLELNYGLQLARGVRLLPALQYVFDPDTTANPAVLRQPGNAFVVGARLTFDLHDTLGLPIRLDGR